MAGPLFRELAEGVAPFFPEGAILLTGHPDTLAKAKNTHHKLRIIEAPGYDRSSMFHRASSWFRYLVSSSSVIARSNREDLFLLVSNPPLLGGWFWLLTRLWRRSYTVLVYDIYPDILVNMGVVGRSNPVIWLWHHMNRVVYRDADAVVTLGKHMAHRLKSNYCQQELDVAVISPWADVHSITPISYHENPLSEEFNPQDKSIVLYSGNMGISHDIDSMLQAARSLAHREDILFLFIGAGECWQDAVDFKAVHSLTNIEVYPFQPEASLPYTMALASLSLVALDDGAEELMVPSKVFYYMASGSSVIGICKDENELRDVVEAADCGTCIPAGKPHQLADQIEYMIDDRSRLEQYQDNARKAALSNYSREAGVDQFISLFTAIGWIEEQNVRKSH